MATIQKTQQLIRQRIRDAYPEPEAGAVAQLVLEHVLQKSRVQLSLQQQEELTEAQEAQIHQAISRLQKQEPVQYVLGVAHFYGLELEVDERVLIPRPETEELVDLVLKEHQGQKVLQVLDICTGSGCIPLALAASLSTAKVYGLEVSGGALEVAKANSQKHNLSVTWLQQDIFDPVHGIPADSLDIITSNPPYVLEEEKQQMRQNVLQFEPHLALFVPDTDALKYYRRVAAVAWELLKDGGKLYFEINERYGKQVQELLLQTGFLEATVVQDLFGKDRIVRALK
ncbi:release factor glutamine methyltransferase [Pontibacter ummariensis]|uniref:Release factor glutamine methyltransferase n=1 Tax=Pontibacter ummariensis TaxID=1610492 RepID=A0A239GWA0_9BACT|nr:peptide chain release factor N(5)-glutamine methyltransferase [Pontibacter ummariensis]PRY11005.1 release factor glutamine methyltransferase [Pontibacter ummariensis]SNS73135.1 release factor glutamine methyltransferase [Pontibacter ummariensis]